jgi:hypothetical protein
MIHLRRSPHPDIKVEASAHEDVVVHFEWAATKQML